MIIPGDSAQKILEECCKGDATALRFCQIFFVWCHTFDDVLDRDKPVAFEDAVTANWALIQELTTNAFWLKNSARLLPLISAGASSSVSSEQFRLRENVLDRVASQVLKTQYAEVFWEVAGICGGWQHKLAMVQKHRAFDYDPCPKPET